MVMHVAVPLLAIVCLVHGQGPTTPTPANFTTQPTDLLVETDASGRPKNAVGLTVLPLATQGFVVENAVNAQSFSLSLPCIAVANPPTVSYTWYKWNAQTKSWAALSISSKYSWNGQPNGDPVKAGMLTITQYDKVADAGSYVCWARTDYATSVSEVLNLTAASFVSEGVQASAQVMSVNAGNYVKLTAPPMNAVPSLNASWTRTSSSAVPSGSGNEIPADRVVMDETGSVHIGYMDNSLLQVVTGTGTTNYNYFHYKCLSLRYTMTDLALFQLSVTGSPPTSASCMLQYQTPSLNLVHGQSSRIVCVFSGSPSIKVTYLKQDASKNFQPLTTQVISGGDSAVAVTQTGLYGNTYMIGAAQISDAGTYGCSATYPGGTCSGSIKPIVVTVDLEPTFVSQPSPVSYVVEGKSTTLSWSIKARPKATMDVGQNGQIGLPTDPNKITSTEQVLTDPVDGLPVYVRTITLMQAIKPSDTRSLQVYASNPYYSAISSVALTVISPITFPNKMADLLGNARGAKATFTCTAYADDSLPITIAWTRFFGGVQYQVTDQGAGGQFDMAFVDVTPPSGLKAVSQTLTVNTDPSIAPDMDSSRGQYACNVSNGVTWNVTSARFSFVGDDPVAAASFEMWMLGPILGGVALIVLVIGIIIVVRRNRGEKYEVEDEEIKKGFDPKKEAHEQRELREYQRDREKGGADEPLRQSQPEAEIERDDEA